MGIVSLDEVCLVVFHQLLYFLESNKSDSDRNTLNHLQQYRQGVMKYLIRATVNEIISEMSPG